MSEPAVRLVNGSQQRDAGTKNKSEGVGHPDGPLPEGAHGPQPTASDASANWSDFAKKVCSLIR